MKADAEVESQVWRMLDRLNAAVSSRDLKETLELFAPDPDVRLIGSEADEGGAGPQELRQFFERIYRGPATYSWTWHRRSVSARGDVAWVVAEGVVRVTKQGSEARHPYRITGVLERRHGLWLWIQFHGSEPARG